jgi:predicted DNA-binding transcriptional regulator AlpA
MDKDSTEVTSPLLTEREAACYLSRSRSSLRRDRNNGSGPGFIQIGRSIRYLRSDLDVYISACRRAGATEVHRG